MCNARLTGRPAGGPVAGFAALDFPAGFRHPCAMLIYKIFRAPEWAALQADGSTEGAPVDLSDGFIHFSTASQAEETALKHFADVEGLWLIAVDAEGLGEHLRWEPSRGGDLFPHLYRPLLDSDVVWAKPLPLVDGLHRFPDMD